MLSIFCFVSFYLYKAMYSIGTTLACEPWEENLFYMHRVGQIIKITLNIFKIYLKINLSIVYLWNPTLLQSIRPSLTTEKNKKTNSLLWLESRSGHLSCHNWSVSISFGSMTESKCKGMIRSNKLFQRFKTEIKLQLNFENFIKKEEDGNGVVGILSSVHVVFSFSLRALSLCHDVCKIWHFLRFNHF